MAENNGKLNHSQQGRFALLRTLRKNMIMRALLAIITVLLTIVVLFSLTVAWYTNVVQTSGLNFQTEQWNFDGEIALGETNISMSPGSGGIVPLTIKNKGDHIVAASVSVSKASLTGEDVTIDPDVTINPYALMRQRLYFYVDATTTRGGETVDRVYLGSNSTYTYTILPNSDLVLTEDSYNAPRIKWEWVYDVLGYYVLGSAVASQTTGEFSDVKILDYIRPIEYEYDETKTTFAGAQLSTIDGKMTVLEFLEDLTKNDGYEGTITSEDGVVNGYYPVSVNEEGYGVWLHMCTYTEIQQNTKNDTALGQMATQPSYPVTILVSGANSREDATYVTSANELAAALKNPAAGIVTLANDMSLSGPIELTDGTNAILNLNGNRLTTTEEEMFVLKSGANLSVYDGTLVGNGDDTIAVYMEGGYLTLQNVATQDVYEGVVVRDYYAASTSAVHIKNSDIYASEDGILFYGQDDVLQSYSYLVIENSRIVGENFSGIYGNGNYRAVDITIRDSLIKGGLTAIYQPQKESVMHLESSTLEGGTALVLKGGVTYVNDCIVRGLAENPEPAVYHPSGWAETGDAIYLEANYVWETKVYISGNTTATSKSAQAVQKYMPEEPHAAIEITGGTFSTDVSAYCADGYVCRDNGDGTFSVVLQTNQ